MTKIKSILTYGAASLFAVGVVATAVAPVFAAEVATGSDSSPASWTQIVEIGSTSKISISSDAGSTASIAASAGTNGGFGVAPATDLTVATNDSRGSILQININDDGVTNSNGTITTLFSGSSSTNVTAVAAPGGAVLNGGSNGGDWGFTFVTNDASAWANAVAGASNVPPTASSTFFGVPAKGSPITLLNDNNAAGSRTGWVNYGAKVTYLLEAGYTYANTVQYTASIGL